MKITYRAKLDFERHGTRGPRPSPSRKRLLALAYHVERLVESGQLRNYVHAARVLGVTTSRSSQITELLNLPAEEQERILMAPVEGERV